METSLQSIIDSYFSSETGKVFIEEKCLIQDIYSVENELNIELDSAHKYILLNYGTAYVGTELLPAKKDPNLKYDSNIADYTNTFKELLSGSTSGDHLSKGYVFSIDGNGDPIFINNKKQVEIYYHDIGEFKLLSQSFAEFVIDNIS